MPTRFSPSITGSAPTFFSAMNEIASKTVLLGEMDQKLVPFRSRIDLMVVVISIIPPFYWGFFSISVLRIGSPEKL
jgi:hypothetical protein